MQMPKMKPSAAPQALQDASANDQRSQAFSAFLTKKNDEEQAPFARQLRCAFHGQATRPRDAALRIRESRHARVKRGCNRARKPEVIAQAKDSAAAAAMCSNIAKKRDEGGAVRLRDRKQRKRQFRGLWIARINAAVREHA